VILGVLLGIGFVLQTVGLGITSASKAAFLTGTLVVFTPLFQLVLERRLPTIPNVIGVVLTSIGLYIFTSPANEAFNFGDLLVMICAVVFAVYVVYVDVFTKEKFTGELVFYQFVTTAIIGFVMVPFSTGGTLFRPSINMFLALLYLAFFASTIALFVQTKYQRETTPTRAALIYTLEPIFAAILAALMLDEHMSSTAVLGAGLMFGGLVASELLSIKKVENHRS
jgi:drug/metabolite transporter (DMT)-like permease